MYDLIASNFVYHGPFTRAQVALNCCHAIAMHYMNSNRIILNEQDQPVRSEILHPNIDNYCLCGVEKILYVPLSIIEYTLGPRTDIYGKGIEPYKSILDDAYLFGECVISDDHDLNKFGGNFPEQWVYDDVEFTIPEIAPYPIKYFRVNRDPFVQVSVKCK